MQEYDYYCLVHDHGFTGERAVRNHRAYYVASPPNGRGQNHATLEQMEVKKPEPVVEVPETEEEETTSKAQTLVNRVKRGRNKK